MANISDEVQIETRTEHELSNQFQSVMGDQSFNVGTLLDENINQYLKATFISTLNLIVFRSFHVDSRIGLALAFGIINVMWLEASYFSGELEEERVRKAFQRRGQPID